MKLTTHAYNAASFTSAYPLRLRGVVLRNRSNFVFYYSAIYRERVRENTNKFNNIAGWTRYFRLGLKMKYFATE